MAIAHPIPRHGPPLIGRRGEREMLDGLIAAIRSGESRAVVVRGEPGVGKTALLQYLADQASDCRLARATGVQPEMELAFSGPLADASRCLQTHPLGSTRDQEEAMSDQTSAPAADRFTTLPDDEMLAGTVVALEEHGFGVDVVDDREAARLSCAGTHSRGLLIDDRHIGHAGRDGRCGCDQQEAGRMTLRATG